MNLEDQRRHLEQHGQSHLLHFWDQLTEPQRALLLSDLAAIDWAAWGDCLRMQPSAAPEFSTRLRPPAALPAEQEPAARLAGEQLLRDGAVAALTVAGGQGSRLGFDGPKGMFPITPLRRASLFQLFAESILATERRYECAAPWFIMTSPQNHDTTTAFFQAQRWFGLDPDRVHFFRQGALPVRSLDGKILLADRHRIAQAPDGHGGTLTALQRSGGLERLLQSGIRYVSYFQVDNPLVKPLDPQFLGTAQRHGAEAAVKVTRKADPDEAVGVLVDDDGTLRVVEYLDMPDTLRRQQAADGTARFDLANMAVHLFETGFLQRVATSTHGLPWHAVRRSVSHVDPASGADLKPDEPNAIKLERFIFDILPLARRSLIYEVQRPEEFSPVKNSRGRDTPQQAHRDQVRRAWHWLEQCGVTPPPDPRPDVEISPLFALDVGQLRERLTSCERLECGTALYLGPR